MKRVLCLTLILCSFLGVKAFCAPQFENIQLEMREFDPVELRAGTFIPVINAQEISTQYMTEGHKVKFIATNDLFMYDTIIVP